MISNTAYGPDGKNTGMGTTPQNPYYTEMENPWTSSSNRVKISSPEEEWETGTELAINEGSHILKKNGQVFIIYSAGESWLTAYNLGQPQLKTDADLMETDSWGKCGRIFKGTDREHGVENAGFTKSPDGEKDRIVYHAKVSPDPGWDRLVHLQPFEWYKDGAPNVGNPLKVGESISKPFGECE